tara:strand:- start:2856 stop:3095 length:240 start_codon:yes stop_codon:yes gene_type:complete
MSEVKEQKEEGAQSPLEKAEQLANRLKEENDRTEQLLQKQQELAAHNMLSGRAEAGTKPEAPKEESAKEYAERVMRGEV